MRSLTASVAVLIMAGVAAAATRPPAPAPLLELAPPRPPEAADPSARAADVVAWSQASYDAARWRDAEAADRARRRADERARASRARDTRRVAPAASVADGEWRTVTSTAYCLTGRMASGEPVYRGAVAMNGVPLGSRWEVEGGGVYTVADRIGHGSQFDVAMPGNCPAAVAYGRRTIRVRRIG